MAILTVTGARLYAQKAGFSGQALDIILAIAQAESGLNTLATNINSDSHTFPDGHTGPSEDRGVLQINNYWWPQVTDAMAFDPTTAFQWGYTISKQGTNFTPWSTYTSGAYKRYLTVSTPVTRTLSNALHFSEFQKGYTGTCGETALATALVCASPPIENQTEAIALMLSMTGQMISLGVASASGATTTQALHDEAVRRGFTPDAASFVPFKQPLDPTVLHPYLLANAGVKPIVLEIANGQALPGDEHGLQYHFICVVGINPQGYLCNDGDNPTNGLVTYSWATLEAAVPCGLLAINLQKGANTLGVPTGWTDDGTLLTAPNGLHVGSGFRDYILAHSWNPADVPVGPETHVSEVEFCNPKHGAGTVQFFQESQLSWTQASGVWVTRSGLESSALRSAVVSAQSEIMALRAQLAAAQKAATIDPAVKNALVAALNLLQPQATLAADLQAAIHTLP